LRFFVTPQEAGLICTHAITAPTRSIVVPADGTLTPTDLVELAGRFLAAFHKQPARLTLFDWENDPWCANLDRFPVGIYPLICTPRDTAGEKHEEVFLGPGDSLDAWTDQLGLLPARQPVDVDPLLELLHLWYHDPALGVTMEHLRSAISEVVPSYIGTVSETSLDSRI
jgi:hypothetical protein